MHWPLHVIAVHALVVVMYVPVPHVGAPEHCTLQAVLPVPVLVMPYWQGEHALVPMPAAYVAVGHAEHWELADSEEDPAAQGMHMYQTPGLFINSAENIDDVEPVCL